MGRIGIFVGMIAVLASPLAAHAAWPADDCPGVYQGLNCSVGGTDVCTNEGTYIDCDNFDSGSSDPDELTGVNGSTGHAIIWGNAYGTDFCCPFIDPPSKIVVKTYAGNDTIALNYTDGTRYDWDGASTIEAGNGDDEVYGSGYDCGPSFCDDIDVGYGEDDAYGYDGRDRIAAPSDDTDSNYFRGGDGNDALYGGAGADILYGDPGHDTIRGGSGGDYIEGGNGNDRLNGNDGLDGLKGGLGDDILCGDATDDSTDDKLDGGPGSNDWCYDGLDTCLAGCDGNCPAGPAACPF